MEDDFFSAVVISPRPRLDENRCIIFIKKALPRYDGVSSNDLYTNLDVFRRPPPPPPNNLRDGEDGIGAGADDGDGDGDGDAFLEDDTDMEEAVDEDKGNIVGSFPAEEEEEEDVDVGEGNMAGAGASIEGKNSVSSRSCPFSL